ncbi:AbiH family protein [Streptococcus sp. E24BD]|uniref:AbiH family protein n=1 Tax=Streptococcus sp. E24BD TaxID=3278715 RepID=UPI00359E35C7
MNITYIVGNGLDIQYGLATRYKDFYNYQKTIYEEKKASKGYHNYIYENLFLDEVNDYENWSDFEFSIGKLTKENQEIVFSEDSKEKFIEDFADVIDDLREYLKSVENSLDDIDVMIDFKKIIEKIIEDLPELHRTVVRQQFKKYSSDHIYIEILTLNYTSILDKLYENSTKSFNSPFSNNYYCYMKPPTHAHGTLVDCAIMGVSDSDQISTEFSGEHQGFLIKSQSLLSNRQNMDVRNTQIIQNSHLIILYGVSLGLTDRYLWNQIANKSITDNIPIIIYNYVENFDAGNPIRLKRQYKNFEDRFINNCGIDMENEKLLRENIITVIGKSIFELE